MPTGAESPRRRPGDALRHRGHGERFGPEQTSGCRTSVEARTRGVRLALPVRETARRRTRRSKTVPSALDFMLWESQCQVLHRLPADSSTEGRLAVEELSETDRGPQPPSVTRRERTANTASSGWSEARLGRREDEGWRF